MMTSQCLCHSLLYVHISQHIISFQSYFLSKSIIIIFPFSDKGRGARKDGFVSSSMGHQSIEFESGTACSPFRRNAAVTWKFCNVTIRTCRSFYLKMLHFYKAAKSIIICNLYNDATSALNLSICARQYADLHSVLHESAIHNCWSLPINSD